MSHWYFTVGGLLLSSEARDEYFCLARAVTKAFRSDALLAPAWKEYAETIDDHKMNKYRKELGISLKNEWDKQKKQQVESWTFGKLTDEEKKKAAEAAQAYAFKDYVLLQTLSSRLRSALTKDITSRRRPLDELSERNDQPRAAQVGAAGKSTAQNAASSNAGSTDRPHGPS